jgi:hypothetical protein
MCSINEDCLGRQVSRLRHFLQDPRKDLVDRFCCKPVAEIKTHRGKMRRFFLERIAQKPAVGYVQIDFLRRPPQGRQSVQVLDQHHLEQYHRIHTGPPVILAVQ